MGGRPYRRDDTLSHVWIPWCGQLPSLGIHPAWCVLCAYSWVAMRRIAVSLHPNRIYISSLMTINRKMTKTGIEGDGHEAGSHVSSFFNYQLQDGFHEIFTYRGHRLQLRGLNVVEWSDDARRQTGFYFRQHFLSWDVKQVVLWRQDFIDSQSEPQSHPVTINHIRFSNQPNFVAAIVHVHKLKVFLAVALDMSFKLFDAQLGLLESIRHEERAILHLEYDGAKDLIFTSGATGISAWKLYRNTSLDKTHVMEKLYSFSGCSDWITKMIYEPQFNRIYALKERTAQVISMSRKAVVTVLEDCHEAPISVVCWYERNQFYLTGCSRGEIKCWTSNYTINADKQVNNSNGRGQGDQTSAKVFALLHTFTGHTKAVTSIKLHPISGLAISTGMDGFVKVLNLEALNELFSIKLDCGVINMQVVKMGPHGYGCLMSLADASIKLWKITSVCDFFATSSSKICEVDSFENLESEFENFYKLKHQNDHTHYLELQDSNDNPVDSRDGADEKKSDNDADEESKDKGRDKGEASSEARKKDSEEVDGGKTDDRIIATFSSQDLRCFTHKGQLLGRLEPEHIVDGIKAYTVSVYQKILICLCERDRIRVHDLRRFTFPLIYEFSLHGDVSKAQSFDEFGGAPVQKKSDKEDLGVCCALIDLAPGNILRGPKPSKTKLSLHNDAAHSGKRDIRGHAVPDYIESYLLIGLNNGCILFLDTLNNFEVQMNFQANNDLVEEIKYRRRLRQLLVLGKDFSETFNTVRIWQLPEMELIAEVSNLRKISSFAISLSTSYFAVGSSTGTVRLFNIDNEDKAVNEVGKISENHESGITSICFCDEIRVVCSSSQDSKVKFWDFEKRLVRTIKLNLPSCGVIQNGKPGDVIMAQNHYLLTIPRRIWDEGDILEDLRQQILNSQTDTTAKALTEDIIDSPSQKVPSISQSNLSAMIPPIVIPTLDLKKDEDSRRNLVSSTPKSRRASFSKRMAARRGSKIINTLVDPESDLGGKKMDRKRDPYGSLLHIHQPSGKLETDQSKATAVVEELEQQVFLPQLQAAQFQFMKGSKVPQLEENSIESVYSRMQQYISGADKHQRQHRPSDPFIFDTLHPRFLIHKKPPARALQLEDLENFDRYIANLNSVKANDVQKSNTLNAGLVRYRKSTLGDNLEQRDFSAVEQPAESKSRRIAQFGLSPRARLTLINSKPIESAPKLQSTSSSSSIRSDQANSGTVELVQQMQKAIADAMIAKAQESIICSTAVGMKVSSQYRKHRESVIKSRQDRFDHMKQRSSVVVSDQDHASLMKKYKESMQHIRDLAIEEDDEDDEEDNLEDESEEDPALIQSSRRIKLTRFQANDSDQEIAHVNEKSIESAGGNVLVRNRKPIKPQLVSNKTIANKTNSGKNH